jgi:phospholipid/cholesterol/gamma-HCH transport system permease protein
MTAVLIAEIQQMGEILKCTGAWTARQLQQLPDKLSVRAGMEYVISGQDMTAMDTAGALFLNRYLQQLMDQKIRYHLEGFQPKWLDLIQFVGDHPVGVLPELSPGYSGFARMGHSVSERVRSFFHFFDFIGQMVTVLLGMVWRPHKWHCKTIVNAIDQTGVKALPIVGLLCFLIGVVLAYQLGIQLKVYGANILIVFLTGIAILREFGPLIAAIIMAGRTSSAFTAEIASMKVNQEIDALSVMGLSPIEFLVIPKVIALLIVFPLLIFWADLFGVMGSMLMAKFNLGVSYTSYLNEFANSVDVKQLLIGLSKAPVFALIIVMVGCYQGFQVDNNADSVGKKTTKSVVQAIFLIIIADALFSILYGNVGV